MQRLRKINAAIAVVVLVLLIGAAVFHHRMDSAPQEMTSSVSMLASEDPPWPYHPPCRVGEFEVSAGACKATPICCPDGTTLINGCRCVLPPILH